MGGWDVPAYSVGINQMIGLEQLREINGLVARYYHSRTIAPEKQIIYCKLLELGVRLVYDGSRISG